MVMRGRARPGSVRQVIAYVTLMVIGYSKNWLM
jgi:hypothetical protein